MHVGDSLLGLLLPNLALGAYNVILMRTYFTTNVPKDILEAAEMDSCGELGMLFRIALPLSKPMLSTVALFSALAYWNDWQNGLYYLTPRGGSRYYTIQVILNNINENIQTLLQNANFLPGMTIKLPSTTIRMAIATVGILPILIIYPFFQKYFVKGITLGGVKE